MLKLLVNEQGLPLKGFRPAISFQARCLKMLILKRQKRLQVSRN